MQGVDKFKKNFTAQNLSNQASKKPKSNPGNRKTNLCLFYCQSYNHISTTYCNVNYMQTRKQILKMLK